jgi:hypothetical protein
MVDGRNARRPFFDTQMPHHKHRGGNTTVNSALANCGPRSFRLDDQWPKNSHNRMITGIGTPINQSRSPRPIAASFKTLWIQNAKGDVEFRRQAPSYAVLPNENPPDGIIERVVSRIRV